MFITCSLAILNIRKPYACMHAYGINTATIYMYRLDPGANILDNIPLAISTQSSSHRILQITRENESFIDVYVLHWPMSVAGTHT